MMWHIILCNVIEEIISNMLQKEQTLVSDLSYENGHFISIPSHKLFPLIIMQGDIIVFPPYNQIDNTLICHDYYHGKKTATVVMLLHLETVCFFLFLSRANVSR